MKQQQKKKPKVKKIRKQKYDVLPFQLCPKCNGSGTLSSYSIDNTGMSTIETCDLCLGAMVIPQALIPINK